MDYAFTRVRTADRDFGAAYQELLASKFEALAPARLWGTFAGLFGVGSNEMIIVSAGDVGGVDQALRDQPRVVETETTFLVPTVRPQTFERRKTPGLYVFRFFDVDLKDVDEIASLSQYAWTHFENTADYQAVPQALFRERDDGASHGVMLLCTWYDGLNSWQRSRTPAPEARENFRRRHALTAGTIAFATRLLEGAN